MTPTIPSIIGSATWILISGNRTAYRERDRLHKFLAAPDFMPLRVITLLIKVGAPAVLALAALRQINDSIWIGIPEARLMCLVGSSPAFPGNGTLFPRSIWTSKLKW